MQHSSFDLCKFSPLLSYMTSPAIHGIMCMIERNGRGPSFSHSPTVLVSCTAKRAWQRPLTGFRNRTDGRGLKFRGQKESHMFTGQCNHPSPAPPPGWLGWSHLWFLENSMGNCTLHAQHIWPVEQKQPSRSCLTCRKTQEGPPMLAVLTNSLAKLNQWAMLMEQQSSWAS